MERAHLQLVEPKDFETPIVREIPPKPPKAFNLYYLHQIQTLPDNVYLLPKTPPLDPEVA